ncbi:MAG TPA: ATP-binding cassette domain-containing protein [Acidiferrobacteraceae bacterium]|nr:ATP-binding cassette domain-containing protein [Acidiferrobacteraceae bacterium]
MSNNLLVEVDSVSRYFGDLAAVNDVSFTVNKGTVLGFLGPNGAGKTTTMQMITGNLAPTSGRIKIAGYDLLDEPRAAKACIGYLPEQPPLYLEYTVDEYLDFCAALNRIPKKQRLGARQQAKERCGLTDAGRRLIGNLSKGYRQRVGIAQAIIHQPQVVILDEPTAGLDPIQIREIRTLVRELSQEHAVILSTHILPEVQSSCDHVQIIDRGKLVLNDSIDGLTQRMQSSTLSLRFSNSVDTSRIEQLNGVRSTRLLDDGRYQVYYQAGQDPTDALVKLAVDNHWGLRELIPEKASLEDMFLELTKHDKTQAEATI